MAFYAGQVAVDKNHSKYICIRHTQVQWQQEQLTKLYGTDVNAVYIAAGNQRSP